MQLRKHFQDLIEVQLATIKTHRVTIEMARMVEIVGDTVERGGTIYAFGNGGSASQADHFVGELLGRFESTDRPAIRAHNLAGEMASLTAVTNDFGQDAWPARAMSYTNERDCILFLSTSGRSPNVVRAAEYLWERRDSAARPMLITGRGYLDAPIDHALMPVVVIESTDTSRIQELTLPMLHALVRELEKETDE